MKKSFLEAVQNRRSFYGITKESTISNEQIQQIIEHAVSFAPSAFNSQTGRVILLLHAQHDALWDATKEILQEIVVDTEFASTKEKLDSFKAGYGTILFFEDQKVIESLQMQYSAYKENFPIWSLQSSGMLQYIIWAALEDEGLGASLQHYNPLIDERVRQLWGVPVSWKLLAQMPFGKPVQSPGEKEIQPVKNRVKIFS